MSNCRIERAQDHTPPGRLHRLTSAAARGQALVEYALITVLVVLAIVVALTATGPAIGNIFSNTVFNLIGAPAPSATPLNPTEFWRLVTAVASYTPPSVSYPTNTPAPPTLTPTLGPSDTPVPTVPSNTPLPTNTPGPSPTPPDIIHNAPFYDNISNANWWRMNPGSVYAGANDWTVQWWTNTNFTGTTCTQTVPFTQEINFRWGSGSPASTGSCLATTEVDTFSTRWTRVVSFPVNTTVRLTTVSDDGIRVSINGTQVAAISSWADQSETVRSTNYTFNAGTNYTIVVEYYENSGGATMVFLMRDAASTSDVGACSWAFSSENGPHSPSDALSDSPGAYYSNGSTCHIALRGAVNLSPLTSPPRMVFWERWRLANYDRAWLQIREYGSTGAWSARLLRRGSSTQVSWTRQEIDLANFQPTDASGNASGSPVNWTGRTIEFRFVLEADTNGSQEDGWWIDDIAIENNVLNRYYVGFSDNMEAVPNNNWLPGGSWAIAGPPNDRVRSGNGAWSDSPGGAQYINNANATLELNGVVDLTTPSSVDPVLVFYHSWALASSDRIYVEVSPDRVNWTSLTENNPNQALRSYSSNVAFVREEISLNSPDNPYDNTVFYLRFRLWSDSSNTGDGWWIDDISLQNRASGYLPYPYYDPMDSSTANNWLPSGSWAIASEQNPHSPPSAWTDSPGGNYTHGTDTYLQTALPFLLTTTQSTNPVLSFWYKRALNEYDNVSVEISTNNGVSWTTLAAYNYDSSSNNHPEANGTARYEFNTQLAWEYVAIDMRAYRSDTTPFLIRFRLNALTDGDVADGVWIDDVQLAEAQETLVSVPFRDDMEGTSGNWRAGGQWAQTNDGTNSTHSGSSAWSDSPGAYYQTDTWSVLELLTPIDLRLPTGSFPALYWWDRFNLGNDDYARVQISSSVWDAGTSTWGAWGAWTELYRINNTTTLSWGIHQADLRPYLGSRIRLRFVLDALENAEVRDGWWIDDVSVVLYNPTVYNIEPAGFYDGAESLSNWITEGTWGMGTLFRGTGSGPASLGPGSWTAYFYNLREWGTCGGSSDAARATNAINGTSFSCSGVTRTFTRYPSSAGAQIGNINLMCGSTRSPAFNGTCSLTSWKADGSHDYMAIQFVRTVTVGSGPNDIPPGTYSFTLEHDDGARMLIGVDGGTRVEIIPNTACSGTWTNTTTCSNVLYDFQAGHSYTLEVRWYESTGNANIRLSVARQSYSFHDSPAGNYAALDNMAIILDGVINMTGAVNPVLSWYEQLRCGTGDRLRVEVSAPLRTGGTTNWFTTWYTIDSRTDPNDITTWTQRSLDLRTALQSLSGTPFGNPVDFTNLYLTFRFRLDARTDTNVNDGWWIDDIVVAD